jgi:WD40 repeat protein
VLDGFPGEGQRVRRRPMRSGTARVFIAIAACSGLAIIGASAPDAAAAVPRAAAAPAWSAPGALPAPGAQLWAKRIAGGGDPTAGAAAVVVSPAGDRVFVTGESGNGYATVAYSAATGARLWVERYPGPNHWTDYATAIAVSPDGKTVFVTGTSVGTTPGDYATIAYNAATGARRWFQRYSAPGDSYDTAFSIAVSPSGKSVFVTGGSGGIVTDTDYLTVAYSAVTGARRWVRWYDGPGNVDDAGISIAVSPASTAVFVTGTSWGTGTSYDYATIAYNAATGKQLWVARYNGPGNGDDTALSVAVTPAGKSVFVTGYSKGAASGQDYATVAYSASTGARLWAKRYNGSGNGRDQGHAVAISPSGRIVLVTGHSKGATSGADDATIAYNAASGARLWVTRYNGPRNGDDAAASLTISAAGTTAFVTGTSQGGSTGFDYATIAYNAATGAQLWAARYDGPSSGDDGAMSEAVSPDGKTVFVTGHSQGSAGPDYATIAYNG